MATDIWRGFGNWTGNPSNWSTGLPPASTDTAVIFSGSNRLTTSTEVESVVIASGASLFFDDGALITTGDLTNDGLVAIDNGDGEGGSSLAVGGQISNARLFGLGNPQLSASDTVTAAGVVNSTQLIVQGNAEIGSTNQATLDIAGAAPSTLTGRWFVLGDGLLEFGSGSIESIGLGEVLELAGAGARVALASDTTTSSALTGLERNDGIIFLEGNTPVGAGGVSVITNQDFVNNGRLDVDTGSGTGGSSLTIGGKLINTDGGIDLGNSELSASDTVTANELVDNGGLISVQGNAAALDATGQATLDITGAAPGTLLGGRNWSVRGDGLIEFGSGSIGVIENGAAVALVGAGARIADASDTTTNSALTSLGRNGGEFSLEGDTPDGAGGVSVTTNQDFINNGVLDVDGSAGSGGSSLTIGGKLINSGTIDIGNSELSASDTVTANELVDNGGFIIISVQGNAAALDATGQATLDITGAAPSTVTGAWRVSGDALVEFKRGAIKSISRGSELTLYGPGARIALASDTTTSSALTHLGTNDGHFALVGGAAVTTRKNFTNNGSLSVDELVGYGSHLTIGGKLTNAGTAVFGNTDFPTPVQEQTIVEAAALKNSGSLTLEGSDGLFTELFLKGNATNTGNLTIGADTQLVAGHAFQQDAGITTVAGLLTARDVDADGGLIDFQSALTSRNGTGALDIGASGTIEFDDFVANDHTVTFTHSTGIMALTSPGSFDGTIAGFSQCDIIHLIDAEVTALSYSGDKKSGELTVSGSGGTIASLHFVGDFTTASFQAVSDGQGGTNILNASSSPNVALLGSYMSSTFASSGNGLGVTTSNNQDSTQQLHLALPAHA
jgi:hypothetical protein